MRKWYLLNIGLHGLSCHEPERASAPALATRGESAWVFGVFHPSNRSPCPLKISSDFQRRYKKSYYLFLFCYLAVSFSVFAETMLYDGEIIPKDFIPFLAPQNIIKLPFWISSSNSIQISMVEREGKEVNAGDVIARFLFRMDNARTELERQFTQMQANNKSQLLQIEKEIEALRVNVNKSQIHAESAELDRQKSKSLSRIKQEILEFDSRLLAFEAKALSHKLKFSEANFQLQKQLLEKIESRWKTYFDIFDATKERYTIRAPQSGELYFPTLEAQKRKVRISDRMNSGVHFLSLVTSSRCELKFFVPEKDFQKVKIGDLVSIQGEKQRQFKGKVSRISFFPQLLGFLYGNFQVPNSWDKCFVINADIQQNSKKLPLGRVKVRLLHP